MRHPFELVNRVPFRCKSTDGGFGVGRGVVNGNHLVVHAVHDEPGMMDAPVVSESLAFERFPVTERRDLSARHVRPETGLRSSLRCESLRMKASPAA